MNQDEVTSQIQIEAKGWSYLSRKKRDELLDRILAGKIPSGEFER